MTHSLVVDSVILEFSGRKVLQDVYLKCETGRVTGLLGRNGAGKTCLMNIMYGELFTENKSVRLNGETFISNARLPRDLRYCPQFNFIPKSVTVQSVLRNFEVDPANFTLEFPELQKYLNKQLGSLSGGLQRVVEVYAILASKTKFCLLDEPFSHIAPLHIEKIKKIIKTESNNKGILLTDHLYEHIVEVSDEVYLIKDGKTYLTSSRQDIETLGYAIITD